VFAQKYCRKQSNFAALKSWWRASSTFATQGAVLAALRDAVDLELLAAASRWY